MSLPVWLWVPEGVLWATVAFCFGAVVGSFLNVVIWRLPQRKPGESLLRLLSLPGSHCPHCDRPLRAFENIPMVSIVFLGARCRTCKGPISWRYFWVEALTAILFLAFFLHFRSLPLTLFYGCFAAPLIAGACIDLERFEIPDELNSFALFVGIAFDVWAIVTRQPGHEPLWGWLPRSIPGAMLCAGVFVFIQVLGAAMFKKDAMGDGDVKLARAIGAMLPLSLALLSFILAIAAGAVIGVLMIAFHSRQTSASEAEQPAVAASGETEAGEDSEELLESAGAAPLRETLFYGAVHVFFIDQILGILYKLRVPFAKRFFGVEGLTESSEDVPADPFVAGPTHIPFGPYMVLGAFLAVFVGSPLIDWYLSWSHLNGR